MDTKSCMLEARQAENPAEDILAVQEVLDLGVPIAQDRAVRELEVHVRPAIDRIPGDDRHGVQVQAVLVPIDRVAFARQKNGDALPNPLVRVQDRSHRFELEHTRKK